MESKEEEGPVSFPIEEYPGGADCAPQCVEQDGAIGLPREGRYKSISRHISTSHHQYKFQHCQSQRAAVRGWK